jgi:CheY-like chemotaxis protein
MPEPPRKPRIFVVDDEPIIASSTAMILRHAGFDATSFTDPLQALKAARTEAPDFLLSDVLMPRMSGIELAVQMQRSCPKCKVLLFSGQAATFDLLQAAHLAGHDFGLLSKPVPPTEMLRRIQLALASVN